MAAPSLLSIDGKKYMNTKTAAELWGLSSTTVSNYCKNNKIKNKFKSGKNRWYISIDEIKPLTQPEIYSILFLTLELKNNPAYEIDWTLFEYDESILEKVYFQLSSHGYIQHFCIEDAKRIPYDVVLTPKGMDFIKTFRNVKRTDASDISAKVAQWLSIIIGVAQLCANQ